MKNLQVTIRADGAPGSYLLALRNLGQEHLIVCLKTNRKVTGSKGKLQLDPAGKS
jgi:hypothetical protein